MSETISNRPTTLTMSELMPPERANFTGHIHGGYLLLLLDRVAYTCAAQYAQTEIVTLSVDEVLFKQPIYVGELVTFDSSLNFVGHTSMEIGIRVTARNLKTGEIRHTNTCYFTMVAIDESGKPTAVAPYEPKTETEQRRFKEAQTRKNLRLEYQQRHKELKHTSHTGR